MGNVNIDLSVIVAVYNTEKYLDECMESLLLQSVEQMEIVVVNDGSQDRSYQILEKYAKSDSVRIISKKHEGTLLTRLEGMRHARGKYITFMDSDDTFKPYSLHNVLSIAEGKNVDILEFGYRLLNSEAQEIFYCNMGHQKMPMNVLIKGKKECFDLIDAYRLEACLCKRLYSRKVCNKVLNYFTCFPDYKIRFKDILVEDEFMTPLFFANAKSYYSVKERIYNYKFRNPGGTTYSMSVNNDRMLRGAEEYMCACSYISTELRKKGIVNTLGYYDYKIRGIDFFLTKCETLKIFWLDQIQIMMKYYSIKEIIFIYIRKYEIWLLKKKAVLYRRIK